MPITHTSVLCYCIAGDWTLQYWIGLRDNSGWKWVGSNQALSYHMWGAGQPNSGSEECAVTRGVYKDWHDVNCGASNYFVCEILV